MGVGANVGGGVARGVESGVAFTATVGSGVVTPVGDADELTLDAEVGCVTASGAGLADGTVEAIPPHAQSANVAAAPIATTTVMARSGAAPITCVPRGARGPSASVTQSQRMPE